MFLALFACSTPVSAPVPQPQPAAPVVETVEREPTCDKVTITQEDLLAKTNTKCVYVRGWNVELEFPANCDLATPRYDAAIFPVLRFGEGAVVVAVRDPSDPTLFVEAWLDNDQVASDPTNTNWYLQEGSYNVESELPQLCPTPTVSREGTPKLGEPIPAAPSTHAPVLQTAEAAANP